MTKSVDLSEFVKLSHPRKAPCRVGAAAAVLGDGEGAKLLAACDAVELVTPGAISEWLHTRGHEVSTSSVVSHRRGSCSCTRR